MKPEEKEMARSGLRVANLSHVSNQWWCGLVSGQDKATLPRKEKLEEECNGAMADYNLAWTLLDISKVEKRK